jgi:hypothetical protein
VTRNLSELIGASVLCCFAGGYFNALCPRFGALRLLDPIQDAAPDRAGEGGEVPRSLRMSGKRIHQIGGYFQPFDLVEER